jgi:ligand-binding sensor domain-containing protein/two-component sensor histidine kinase
MQTEMLASCSHRYFYREGWMRSGEWRKSKSFLRTTLVLGLLLAAAVVGPAEQLPVRTYTTADGLPRDFVVRIVRDSHGFLWFCTSDGLSRFNGYDFTTYGVEQGLPHPVINDLLETRSGVYWVATNGGGVARFNPSPPREENLKNSKLFTAFSLGDEPNSSRVNVLYEDRAGTVWAGTDEGLFRLESSGQPTFRRVLLNLGELEHQIAVRALAEDREGSMWVSSQGYGLLRYFPDGRTVRYPIQPSPLGDLVESLLLDSEDRLWIAHRGGAGLVVFKPEPASSFAGNSKLTTRKLAVTRPSSQSPDQRVSLPVLPGEVRRFTTADGLLSDLIQHIYQSADRRIWVSTTGGLSEFSDGLFRDYKALQGPNNAWFVAQTEDRDGNLWFASPTGAVKITWSGFTTFNKADGLGKLRITSIFEGPRRELFAANADGEPIINRFDGKRFTAVWPEIPRDIKEFGWGHNQVTFQDHTGEWWVPTGSGLCRFPRVASVEQLAHIQPMAVYDHRRGQLPGDDVFRLFEDTRGDVWISIAGNLRNAVVRWDRASETFHVYSEAQGLAPFSLPTAYREDAAGNLWMGLYNGGVARYHDGRFQLFTHSDGVPDGLIRSLYLDHAGRLWIASDSGGVARLDEPRADHPSFVTYTIADGLSSNSVWCITEDKLERMYFGTARGLDRFDLETKHIRHYTKADGLASNAVTTALRDRQGVLWFGTDVGLSRLIPEPDPPRQQPPVLISGMRIAGNVQAISALGETEISGLVLNPSQNQLSIDFVGLGFAAGEALKYQYKLVGASDEWSAPTDQRTINYASLSPGKYRFIVRAVTSDGIVSAAPATISFNILPPLWQRWWFITLIALTLGLIAAALYRYRVARLIELERVRTRIATDLHDDIGASLSLIAMLSEVAQRQAVKGNFKVGESLSSIAASSRELVDNMSDIVWAVNPGKDRFSELVKRMRRFASDVLSSRDITLRFDAADDQDFKLGADARREIFFIVKEGVNNIARHSACTEAAIILKKDGGWLTLELRDNGKGIDAAQANEGNGLASMRERARRLRGQFELASANGHGTKLTLRVPVERQRWRWSD